ncbi:MAG: NAD(P)/FAD-dependent oxidoreductase [Solirubrobacteraceae bacterium]
MSRVVVLGAGIAGHTAAAFARSWLGKDHTVTVISPRPDYNWVPSNIWVGVGLMAASKVSFPLAPIYERAGIEFVQAAAEEIYPEGNASDATPYVTARHADGHTTEVRYDSLINATGPALRFDKTPGARPGRPQPLGLPAGPRVQAAAALDEEVERMRRGERRKFLVGVGHGTCTCEGAAFEYIVNLEFELRHRGMRDKATITWITNEYELGHFGMGGMHLKRAGYITPSSIFNASLCSERGIDWITRAHIHEVQSDRVRYETLDGVESEQEFDFAMLLPPFSGARRLIRPVRRSPSGCSCPTCSCASTPTTQPSRMRSGRRPTGRAPTSHPTTPTSSRRGSRSRRPTRSRCRARARTARSSRPRRRGQAAVLGVAMLTSDPSIEIRR